MPLNSGRLLKRDLEGEQPIFQIGIGSKYIPECRCLEQSCKLSDLEVSKAVEECLAAKAFVCRSF